PGVLLTLAVVLYLVARDSLSAPSVAILNAAAWGASLAIGTLFLMRKTPTSVRRARAVFKRSEWLRGVLPLVFSALAYQLLSRGDVLILGIMGSSRDVGLYTAASRGAELVLFVYTALTLAGASLFAALHAAGNRAELQRFTTLVTRI